MFNFLIGVKWVRKVEKIFLYLRSLFFFYRILGKVRNVFYVFCDSFYNNVLRKSKIGFLFLFCRRGVLFERS